MTVLRNVALALILISFTSASAANVGLIFWAFPDHAPPTAALESYAPELRADVVRMSSFAKVGAPGVQLPSTLKEGDQISAIVIGTSARAPYFKPRTILDGIGGFGPNGAYGDLKNLLIKLGEQKRLGPHLHLTLLAPKALGNGTRAVETRVQALAKQLETYGVRTLSVWGPRGPLLVPAKANQSQGQLARQQVFESLLKWGSLVPTYLAIVGFRYYFDQDVERAVIMLTTFTAAFAFAQVVANLHPLFRIIRGQAGRLVQVDLDSNEVSSRTVPLDSRLAYTGPACKTALE